MSINTGIDNQSRAAIADNLSRLLADTYTLYLKTQSYHWNVTGSNFHALHSMFEEQYQDLADAVDVIAERIRALGFSAPGSYTQYVKLATVKEDTTVPQWQTMVQQLLSDHETIIANIRNMLPVIEEIDDEVSLGLLAERMNVHEKTAWMLRSTLG